MPSLSVEKIYFHIPKRFEKLLNLFNWSKQTVNIFKMDSRDLNWSLQSNLKMHVKRLFFLYPSIPLIIPPYYTPCFFVHRVLKLPRQRLLWTFKSQQRYVDVSTGSNDDFKTVFEVIQNISESIFDIALRQLQNHSVDHEIARNFYTPENSSFAQLFHFQKSFSMR